LVARGSIRVERDLGLFLGALALGRLSQVYDTKQQNV
jgi:hypothetical protein